MRVHTSYTCERTLVSFPRSLCDFTSIRIRTLDTCSSRDFTLAPDTLPRRSARNCRISLADRHGRTRETVPCEPPQTIRLIGEHACLIRAYHSAITSATEWYGLFGGRLKTPNRCRRRWKKLIILIVAFGLIADHDYDTIIVIPPVLRHFAIFRERPSRITSLSARGISPRPCLFFVIAYLLFRHEIRFALDSHSSMRDGF